MQSFAGMYWWMYAIKKKIKKQPRKKKIGVQETRKTTRIPKTMGKGGPGIAGDTQTRKQSVHIGASKTVPREISF